MAHQGSAAAEDTAAIAASGVCPFNLPQGVEEEDLPRISLHVAVGTQGRVGV